MNLLRAAAGERWITRVWRTRGCGGGGPVVVRKNGLCPRSQLIDQRLIDTVIAELRDHVVHPIGEACIAGPSIRVRQPGNHNRR